MATIIDPRTGCQFLLISLSLIFWPEICLIKFLVGNISSSKEFEICRQLYFLIVEKFFFFRIADASKFYILLRVIVLFLFILVTYNPPTYVAQCCIVSDCSHFQDLNSCYLWLIHDIYSLRLNTL